MLDSYKVEVTINHNSEVFDVSKTESLACVLREKANLCWPAEQDRVEEKCRSCNYNKFPVLLNGNVVNATFVLAMDIGNAEIETFDSLYSDPSMKKIIDSFIKCQADQYGYCILGMELALYATLRHESIPTREDVRRMLSGNLCSCTGERKIEKAIDNILKIATTVMNSQAK